MAIYYDGYDWDVDGFPGEFIYGDHAMVLNGKSRYMKNWMFEYLDTGDDTDDQI